jgi:hypothetical protein
MRRSYLKLHLWLKAKCDQLSLRQRQMILFSVSAVYFFCSAGLIISAFIPNKEIRKKEQTEMNEEKTKRNIPKLIDSPIGSDSLYRKDTTEQIIT